MRRLWYRYHALPWYLRRPMGLLFVALVVLLVCYPKPWLLWRQVQRMGHLHELADPHDPALAEVDRRFQQFLAREYPQVVAEPEVVLEAVARFVYTEIPYAWDWETWSVADYTPTVAEVIAQGQEDCDGRAVLATALLRRRGMEANLVAGDAHVWVSTPLGETMGHGCKADVYVDETGVHGSWMSFFDMTTIAFGVAVFPWPREVIVVLALWLVWLPGHIRWPVVLPALGLMLVGLFVIRWAGAGHLQTHVFGVYWGLAHIAFAAAMMWLWGKNRNIYRPVCI